MCLPSVTVTQTVQAPSSAFHGLGSDIEALGMSHFAFIWSTSIPDLNNIYSWLAGCLSPTSSSGDRRLVSSFQFYYHLQTCFYSIDFTPGYHDVEA